MGESAEQPERQTRWQKAVSDTEFFRWKREIVIGLVAGVFAVLALVLFTEGDAVKAELIVLASVAAAMIALPLAELAWNWLQAPMRLLTEDVALLRQDVRGLRASAPVDVTNLNPELRSAIHALLDELITIRASLQDVQDMGAFSWDFRLPNHEWATHRDALAAHVARETRRLVGNVYVNVDRMNEFANERDTNGSKLGATDKASVAEVRQGVDKAIDALDCELKADQL